MSNDPELFNRAVINFLSGGIAGLFEVSLMHPLDLIKTRMQLQKGKPSGPNDPNYYHSILDCFRKLYRNEGLLSFWKGIIPPMLSETPTKSVRFTVFKYMKKLLTPPNSPELTIPKALLCGYTAGFMESFVICPFEVVKVVQQSSMSHAKNSSSAWSTAKDVLKTDGFFGKRGVYRGLGATIYRHSIFNAVYLGLYYPVRIQIEPTENRWSEMGISFALGVSTGSFACFFNIPFDVAKSRIQAPQKDKIKYVNSWQSIRLIMKEEGPGALYKGIAPKMLRLGPGGAIMIIVFEFVNTFLSSKFL